MSEPGDLLLLIYDEPGGRLASLPGIFAGFGWDAEYVASWPGPEVVDDLLADAVVVDAEIPGGPRGELFQKLMAAFAHTPVVVATPLRSLSQALNFFRAGAGDYQTLPASPEEWRERIEESIARHRRRGGEVYSTPPPNTTKFLSANQPPPAEMKPEEAPSTDDIVTVAAEIIVDPEVVARYLADTRQVPAAAADDNGDNTVPYPTADSMAIKDKDKSATTVGIPPPPSPAPSSAPSTPPSAADARTGAKPGVGEFRGVDDGPPAADARADAKPEGRAAAKEEGNAESSKIVAAAAFGNDDQEAGGDGGRRRRPNDDFDVLAALAREISEMGEVNAIESLLLGDSYRPPSPATDTEPASAPTPPTPRAAPPAPSAAPADTTVTVSGPVADNSDSSSNSNNSGNVGDVDDVDNRDTAASTDKATAKSVAPSAPAGTEKIVAAVASDAPVAAVAIGGDATAIAATATTAEAVTEAARAGGDAVSFRDLPVGLLVYDGEGRFLRANPAAARLLGFDDVAAMRNAARTSFGAFSPLRENGQPLYPGHWPMDFVRRDRGTHSALVSLRPRDGQRRWIRFECLPTLRPTGLERITVVLADLSSERSPPAWS